MRDDVLARPAARTRRRWPPRRGVTATRRSWRPPRRWSSSPGHGQSPDSSISWPPEIASRSACASSPSRRASTASIGSQALSMSIGSRPRAAHWRLVDRDISRQHPDACKVHDRLVSRRNDATRPPRGRDAPGNRQHQGGRSRAAAAYVSPEQAEGKPVDARSDVFSFGSVLYEMLTGQRPFTGDSSTTARMAVVSKPPAPPRSLRADVPLELERLVLRCLEKPREARPASGGELLERLRDVRAAARSRARPAGRPLAAARGRRTRGPRAPGRGDRLRVLLAEGIARALGAFGGDRPRSRGWPRRVATERPSFSPRGTSSAAGRRSSSGCGPRRPGLPGSAPSPRGRTSAGRTTPIPTGRGTPGADADRRAAGARLHPAALSSREARLRAAEHAAAGLSRSPGDSDLQGRRRQEWSGSQQAREGL